MKTGTLFLYHNNCIKHEIRGKIGSILEYCFAGCQGATFAETALPDMVGLDRRVHQAMRQKCSKRSGGWNDSVSA
ncbi:hypothetical protein DV713_12985 [Parageobacillus thermoglucosidasius]|nr:hypothetical protein DV713_12985 [Parageobacillus thermoglucosidasius]REK59638.1 MAG: hypothetical protein C6P36_01975 [Geobacillus sp.]